MAILEGTASGTGLFLGNHNSPLRRHPRLVPEIMPQLPAVDLSLRLSALRSLGLATTRWDGRPVRSLRSLR